MAVTATPIFPQTITNAVATIVPADTSSLKTLYTGGSNGSRVENILVTNTDAAAAYAIQLTVVISATNYLIGTVNVPLSAGNTTAAPTVNLLSALNNFGPYICKDSNGNPYLYLANGAVLKVNSTTTVNTSKQVTFFAQGGDY